MDRCVVKDRCTVVFYSVAVILLYSMSDRQVDILDLFINAKIDGALKCKHADKQWYNINSVKKIRSQITQFTSNNQVPLYLSHSPTAAWSEEA